MDHKAAVRRARPLGILSRRLRFTSTTSPSVKGWSVAFVRLWIVCGFSFTWSTKSSFVRPSTSAPFLSRTTTPNTTGFGIIVIVFGPSAGALSCPRTIGVAIAASTKHPTIKRI
jgi:hypothetical protein